MTRLEEALREAFTADVDTAPQDVLRAVRRGAERRRTRRTATVALTAASALVAGITIGGSLLDGGQSRPSPAPAPTELRSSPPAGSVMAVESAGGGLFATVQGETGCDCTELWHFEESAGWREVHEFADERVLQLSMAPDGGLGFANASGTIWITRDGGASWERARIDGAGRSGYDNLLVSTGDPRWPGWAFDAGSGTILRFDGEVFEPVSFERTGGALQAVHVDNGLIVEAATAGYVSRDGAATWTELALPCGSAAAMRLIPARTTVFATCQVGKGTTVHRSSDLSSWHRLGRFQGLVTDQVALSDDVLLLRGAQEVLVSTAGSQPVTTGRGFEVQVPDAAVLGDTIYLATSAGFVISTDGGVTWEEPAS